MHLLQAKVRLKDIHGLTTLFLVMLFFAIRTHAEPLWTVERVLGAIEWREQSLATFKINYSEEMWLSKKDTTDWILLNTLRFDLQASETAMYVTLDAEYPSSKALSFKGQQYLGDGGVWKSMGDGRNSSGKKITWCTISDQIPPSLSSDQLKFQMIRDMFEASRRSVHFRKRLKNPEYTFSTDVKHVDGRKVVVLKIQRRPPVKWHTKAEYEFEVEKDFLLRRSESSLYEGPEEKSSSTSQESLVQSDQNIDGIWIPLRETETVRMGSDSNRLIREVQSFSRSPTPEGERQMSFPVGAEVMDSIAKSYYRIRPDWSHEALQFVDVDTGKLVTPTTSPTTAGTISGSSTTKE